MSVEGFAPLTQDAAGVLTWVHVGDLHMTRAGERNDLDLQAIVQRINDVFAEGTSFVFLPGDVADDGSRTAYAVVRRSLDRLTLPWCAILGDHDVHERSFNNFLEAMASRTHFAFTAGTVRFIAMNAFDIPEPPSFTVSAEQLRWVEAELRQADADGLMKAILLHCYPSDLKAGGARLSELIRAYKVALVEMGHTHYNEIANDGETLFTATRSTGQIEEGAVGFSVTNVDRGAVSWRFFELASQGPAVMITHPADGRLTTSTLPVTDEAGLVRAKVWSDAEIVSVAVTFGGTAVPLRRVLASRVWEGRLPAGADTLTVTAIDANGRRGHDRIRVGGGGAATSAGRDQDHALEAWPEHGLLGTQLGPNKNGKKW